MMWIMFRSFSLPSQLCALYAVTDVALVTSLRDGMNLVSYEYVACQSDNAGERLLPLPTHLLYHKTLSLTIDSADLRNQASEQSREIR